MQSQRSERTFVSGENKGRHLTHDLAIRQLRSRVRGAVGLDQLSHQVPSLELSGFAACAAVRFGRDGGFLVVQQPLRLALHRPHRLLHGQDAVVAEVPQEVEGLGPGEEEEEHVADAFSQSSHFPAVNVSSVGEAILIDDGSSGLHKVRKDVGKLVLFVLERVEVVVKAGLADLQRGHESVCRSLCGKQGSSQCPAWFCSTTCPRRRWHSRASRRKPWSLQ